MKGKGCLIGGGILVILAIVGFWIKGIYNDIKITENTVEEQWANVETIYQKRADLVPNLVNTVKGAANFEQSTLTAVIEARAKATSNQIKIDDVNQLTPENLGKFQAAQDELGGALSRLLVSVERYPELKANANFQNLQVELSSIETEVAFERRKFNNTIKSFNDLVDTFPNNIVANFMGANSKASFKAAAGSENAPTVDFNK